VAALHVILAAYVDPAWSLAGIGLLNLVLAACMAHRALRHVPGAHAEAGGTS
jgi:hypothetical protein